MMYGKKPSPKTMSKPSPAKMKPAPKGKSAGIKPLPKKKGSPTAKTINLPGKKGKPSPMILY